MPAVERDTFWGDRAAQRMPRFAKDPFYGRPKPALETPLLVATSRTPWRFALAMFACGFLGALLYQLTGLGYVVADLAIGLLPPGLDILVGLLFVVAVAVQVVAIAQAAFSILALGAPLFEEFLKVGLALLITLPLTELSRTAARPLVLGVRVLVAAGVGFLFGWSEHFLYAEEDELSYISRLTFHSGSAALSMVTFAVLERVADSRAKWLSTVPATLLHYANNGFVLFWAILGGEAAATLWSVSLSVGTWAAIPLVIVAARPLRSMAARQLQRHLPWQSPAAQAAPAGAGPWTAARQP